MTQGSSRWEDLLGEAFKIIDTVNRDGEILTGWTLGGGTAMMLQIDHRESHDVDLFLEDPQLLACLVAAVADMQFDIGTPTYNGDGSGHLKVAFEGIGEIDFIVTSHVTAGHAETQSTLGRPVLVETIPEIVAKKIRFRGNMLQPRDVFDIAAAAAAGHRGAIETALAEIPEEAIIAAKKLDQLSQDYVESIIGQLMVRPDYKGLIPRALPVARDVLRR